MMGTPATELSDQEAALEAIKEPRPASLPAMEHVVAAHETFQPKRVLCLPLDESKASLHTIQWTLDHLVNKDTDEVLLLHVRNLTNSDMIMAPIGFPYVISPEQISEMEENAKTHSHQLLKDYAMAFQRQGIHVRAVALKGEVRQSLLYKINSVKPTVVVMSNRGLGVVSRVLLGSLKRTFPTTFFESVQ
ncbi:hypothetical protein HDU91_002813 [Kappamyces sp. JEL0680]|nr:hypothetical protein HDU91_002813 [Kappamyces sp. JEL0680]